MQKKKMTKKNPSLMTHTSWIHFWIINCALKKKMRGAVSPLPTTQSFTPMRVAGTNGTPQGTQSPSINVDGFFDLEQLDKMMEKENEEDRAKWAESHREEERQEAEELEAAKAKSLRLAKEEKKRMKYEMRSKKYQEGASSSVVPPGLTTATTAIAELPPLQAATTTEAATMPPVKTAAGNTETTSTNIDEGAQPMDTNERPHRKGKALVDEEKEGKNKRKSVQGAITKP